MKISKFFCTLGLILFVLGPSAVNAQSAIEKSLVAKSKLHNKIWLQHDPASDFQVNHDYWDQFLNKYTSINARGINLVSYSRVTSSDRQALKSYLGYLQSIDVAKLNRNEQYAFWMNLYNASIVNIVLDNLPLKSVLDIKSNLLDLKGPFNDQVAVMYGLSLTPDTIESGIVRPIWKDARLHYGFNCAALSCPNLYAEAFRGDMVDQQLDAAARSFMNDPRGIRVENGELIASKIFFWYSDDYGNSDKAILNHIRHYAEPELATSLATFKNIDRYEYDWTLNGE